MLPSMQHKGVRAKTGWLGIRIMCSSPRARIPTRDVSVIFVLVEYKANIDLLDM
jgi:hypothetical protein